MTIKLAISPEIESKLRERAAAIGADPTQYAAELIKQGMSAPTFEEIVAPIHHDLAGKEMTPEDLDDFGRDLITKVRQERRLRG